MLKFKMMFPVYLICHFIHISSKKEKYQLHDELAENLLPASNCTPMETNVPVASLFHSSRTLRGAQWSW